MKALLVIVSLSLAACAAHPVSSDAAARRHAANVAAAQEAGYKIVNQDGRIKFCSNEAPSGSHIAPGCLTEAEWEQQQMWVWRPTWCPIAAEACSEASHRLLSVSEAQ